MKYLLMALCCLAVVSAKARQTGHQATDSMDYVVQRLAKLSWQVKEAGNYSGVYLDSVLAANAGLGDVLVRNWLMLKTTDSELLDSVLLIRDPVARRKQLLQWKYIDPDRELAGLLDHYGEILTALATIMVHKQDHILLGKSVDYDELAFVAHNHFMLFQEKLQVVMARHKAFTAKNK